jgi:predicted nuclease with TOPRIM domain
MVKPLKKFHGETKELNDQTREAKNLIQEWNKLIMVSNTVDKHIKNIVENHMDKTKGNIKKLEDRLKEYHTSLKKEPFYFYDTGCEGAFSSLNEVVVRLQEF